MEENKISVFKGIWLSFLTLLLAFVLTAFGSGAGELIVLPMLKSGSEMLAFAGEYAAFIGIWILTLLVCIIGKKDRAMLRLLKPKKERIKTSLSFGLILGLGMNLLLAVLALLNGDIVLYFSEFRPGIILLFIVCVFIQSSAEELVTRFFIYRRLQRYFPSCPLVAIITNAMFFSILHIFNPGITAVSLLSIFLDGLLYSMLVYYFDSFWGAAIAHTSWNFCQSILLGLPNSGTVSCYSVFRLDAAKATDSFFYHVDFGIEGTAAAVVACFIACISVFLLGRRRSASES